MLEPQAVDGNFSNKIFFTFGGYVNTENCSIWVCETPHVIEEIPLYTEKITVWCALSSEDVMGLYFFENDDRTTITATSELYGHKTTNLFFWLLVLIKEYDLKNMWFQQHGAKWHTSRANTAWLHETFSSRIISCCADINWPLKSCDLTPLDFFVELRERPYLSR